MAAEADGLRGAAAARTARPAVLQRLPWHALRRLTWGVADQAMSSVSNFAMSLYVARAAGATQFGAFSLAYVTYAFVITASRGLSTDPLMVRYTGTDEATWRRAVTRCTGTSTSVGVIAAVCVLAASAALSGTTQLAFLALGLTLPALTLQDSWRYSFFALGRGSQAFLNDTIWTLGLIPGLLFLRDTHRTNVFWFIFVWGAAAAVAALAGQLQARIVPQLTAAWGWVREHRDLAPRYLAENTSNSGAGQLRTYGIGLILGLAAVGYVQAANTLMGPFLVIFLGMSLVTVPEAARVLRSAPHHLRLFCVLVGCGLALAGLAWGVVLLVALPRGLGHFVLGSLWRPTYPLVLPLTISVMGACFSAGATAGLHALGAARRSLRAMAFASLAYLVFGLLGAVLGGSMGVVCGAAIATWIGALVWWWQLHLGLRESGHLPAARRLFPAARRLMPAGRRLVPAALRPAPARSSGRHRKPSPPPHPQQPHNRS